MATHPVGIELLSARQQFVAVLSTPGSVIALFALLEGERKRTGVVLATARGRVVRLAENAAAKAPALGFDFEHRLRAAVPLTAKEPDRSYSVELTGSMK